jgi:hypothetical protein
LPHPPDPPAPSSENDPAINPGNKGVDEVLMDLTNPWTLLSGLILGAIGMALFIYGKKQMDLRCIAAGAVLCIAPYVISSMPLLWLVSAGVIGGLIAWIKYG